MQACVGNRLVVYKCLLSSIKISHHINCDRTSMKDYDEFKYNYANMHCHVYVWRASHLFKCNMHAQM